MPSEVYFCGHSLTRIENGRLYIPKAFSGDRDSIYYIIIKESRGRPYNYLSIFNYQLSLHSEQEFRENSSNNLEARVHKDGSKSLKIPPAFLNYIQVDKTSEVLLVGMGDHIELWRPDLADECCSIHFTEQEIHKLEKLCS